MVQLPELLTTAEVAEAARVHPATVRRWRTDGTLAGVQVGGQIRFKREDVEALLGVEPTADEPTAVGA